MTVTRPFASIWFDCDSTLTAIEGVDELLQFVPAALRQDIAQLTKRAMEGSLPLAEVYETRLRLLAPRREQLTAIGELYVRRLVPDAALVVAALRHLGKVVGIVSGGLQIPVHRLAAELGIDRAHAHAVPLLFDADGGYQDFDRTSPLWRNGGKVELMRSLPAQARPAAFVGDGVTDLETKGTVELFVGYGGVAVRSAVQAGADAWFATPSVAPLLAIVLTESERAALHRDARFADLIDRSELSQARP